MPEITLIAALAEHRIIGDKGRLAWNFRDYPQDMKRFRELTSDNVVFMGRRTYDSIGRALPKRINIVISSSNDCTYYGDVHRVGSVPEALNLWRNTYHDKEFFVIGGQQVYEQTIQSATRLLLTYLPIHVAGDTEFPRYEQDWVETAREDVSGMVFVELRRPLRI